MLSGTPWRPMGYAWDKGPDIRMTSEYGGAANFIAVTALVTSGKPVDKPSYGSAQGGKRGRSAIGLRGGDLALYCSGDGTGDAATPEALRDELAGLGWASAVMLDGAAPASAISAGSASPPAARCTTGFASGSNRAARSRRTRRRVWASTK